MRHLVKGRKLGRTTPHRKATLQALANALIEHKRIKTTLPKAKELRRFIEPLITKAKTDSTHNRRQIFSALNSKESSKVMFDEIAGAVADRPGGYTRILKLGFRSGDGTEEAYIELVDFSDFDPAERGGKKSKTRRSRGGRRRSGGTSEGAGAATAVSAAEESTAPDVEEVIAVTEESEDLTNEETSATEEVSDVTEDVSNVPEDSADVEDTADVEEDATDEVAEESEESEEESSEEDEEKKS